MPRNDEMMFAKARKGLPGSYETNIPNVFVFPVYDGNQRILDIVSISEDGKQGYSHKYKELKGDLLVMAYEMMRELKKDRNRIIVNAPPSRTIDG